MCKVGAISTAQEMVRVEQSQNTMVKIQPSTHVVEGHSQKVAFGKIENALAEPDTQLRLFGKPIVAGKRRMAVGLGRSTDVEAARAKARGVIAALETTL